MPRPTQGSSRSDSPTPTGLSPAAADLSRSFGFARLRLRRPYNPDPAVTGSVWANPLSLAATRGITCCFLLLGVLRCFSSPRSPLDCSRYPAFCRVGCPIRVSADRFLPANPRGLSQLATPFIAYGTQGIPRAPFSYSFSAHSPDNRLSHAPLRPQTSKIFIVVDTQVYRYWCATRIRCGRLPRGAQYLLESAEKNPDGPPERRCSSRTFRYGYLVTT